MTFDPAEAAPAATYTDSVTARGTDWGLAALVAVLIATGVLTLFAGAGDVRWLFAAHDASAAAIAVLVAVKVRRVWPRLTAPLRWAWRHGAGSAATGLVAAALVSGGMWAAGVTPAPAGYSLLAWHDALGAGLAVAVLAHMILRAKRLRGRDLSGRRQFLALGGVAAGSLLAWRATTARAVARSARRAAAVHRVLRDRVTTIELRASPDYAAPASTVWSSFTSACRGLD